MKLVPIGKRIELTSSEIVLMNDFRFVAELHLDMDHQIRGVVVLPDATSEEELHVLRLTARHVSEYVVNRRTYVFGGLMVAEHRGERSPENSLIILYDQEIPERFINLSAEELKKFIEESGVFCVNAVVSHPNTAIARAVTSIPVKIKFKIHDKRPWIDNIRVTFTVRKPRAFRGWHNVGRPGEGLDLYIVPSYHPDWIRDSYAFLINGDTDALIGEGVVDYVYAPWNGINPARSILGSWSMVKHPFYVQGQNVDMVISPNLVRSEDGIAKLARILSALLELNDLYLSVSGGFRTDLPYPHSSMIPDGPLTRNGRVRGSENFCVWSYQVLKEEGHLDDAYIPKWFTRERWLEAYGISDGNI